MDYDCMACGACCAFDEDWPTVREGDVIDPIWVVDGHVRWVGDRCAALDGEVKACVSCRIYDTRPQTCRDCAPGSDACHVARRAHGLPVPAATSTMEQLP